MVPNKIFFDSNLRASGTHANFSYQLPQSVTIGKPHKIMIDQFHCPHVWTTIHSQNRALYFREVGTHDRQHRILLNEGQYDGDQLALEVMTRLNNAATNPHQSYTVTFDPDQGKLLFDVSSGVSRIYSMRHLRNNPGLFLGHNFEQVGHYDDCGAVIGVHDGVLDIDQTPTAGTHIHVQGYDTIYLHCSAGLSNQESAQSTRGNSSVLRSIPIHTMYGQMIHDVSLNPFDHTLIRKGELATFKFELRDKYGHFVSLDQPFAFSMLLSPVDPFEI